MTHNIESLLDSRVDRAARFAAESDATGNDIRKDE